MDEENNFIDEVYQPTSYRSCSSCKKMINESSIAKMLEEGQNCPKDTCPYKVRTHELREVQWD
jgi:hypothetical protein